MSNMQREGDALYYSCLFEVYTVLFSYSAAVLVQYSGSDHRKIIAAA